MCLAYTFSNYYAIPQFSYLFLSQRHFIKIIMEISTRNVLCSLGRQSLPNNHIAVVYMLESSSQLLDIGVT